MRGRTSLLCVVTLLSVMAPAFAQSDADRATARALGDEGMRLQTAGRFAEALEKFQRSQTVLETPATLLHVAECQEALHQWVEASESFRKLALIEAGTSNAASRNAKQSAAMELALLAPKIPSVKIDVKPRAVKEVSVKIDGVEIPSTAMGSERPTNPGEHRIEAAAPGFTSTAFSFQLAEGEHKVIPITLDSVPVMAPVAPTDPAAPPPTPAVQGEAAGQVPWHEEQAPVGIFYGTRVSGVFPGGQTGGYGTASSEKLSTLFAGGPGIELDLGLRFARHFTALAWYEHDFLSTGSSVNVPNPTASHNAIGLGMQIARSQRDEDGWGPFGEIGVLLLNDYSLTATNSNGFATCALDMTLSGLAARFAAGVHIPVAAGFLLSPFAGIEAGRFGQRSVSNSGQCARSVDQKMDLNNPDWHTAIFAGIGAGAYAGN